MAPLSGRSDLVADSPFSNVDEGETEKEHLQTRKKKYEEFFVVLTLYSNCFPLAS
jgi:hypothetical protein